MRAHIVPPQTTISIDKEILFRFPLEQVHICSRCDFPISIYGQLWPCRHAFCLQCAEEMLPTCYLCFSRVEEVRRIEASRQPLYLCAVCLKGYDSLEELTALVKANGGACCQGQGKAVAENPPPQQSLMDIG